MRKIACSLFLLFVANAVQAAEGFWLASQLAKDPVVQRTLGVNVEAQQPPLDKMGLAIAKVGECSGAFISSTGLFITSAHCIEAYLPKSEKLIAAARQIDEIPLPGLTLDIMVQRDEMTVNVNRQLSDSVSVQGRAVRFEQVKSAIEAQCELKNDNRCELSALHYGLEFYLERYVSLHDIRLVYLPAQVANTKNNNWPRYRADYVILRAYADARNNAAEYGLSNQAYQSQFVKLSGDGVAENELVISPGFSSQSRRFASVSEVQFHFEQLYPLSLLYLQQGVQLLEQRLLSDAELTAAYQATLDDFTQRAKNMSVLLQHYQQSQLLSEKRQQQSALAAWINTSPVRQQLYGPVLSQFDSVMQKQQAILRRDLVLGYLRYAQLPNLALKLYQHALARDTVTKADVITLLQHVESHYDARIDMEMALHYLSQYAQLPPALRLAALDQYFALSDGFNRDIVKHKLAAMYRGTELTSADARQRWLTQAAEVFQRSEDPMISFAVAMQDTVQQLAVEREQFAAELSAARAEMMAVVMAFNDATGRATYAETNGNLRFSFGHVSGYQPTDAVWYQPFSSLKGWYKLSQLNDTDNRTWRQLDSRTAQLPVNFLSSSDSCSGYGFAPTLNSKAELVGIMYSGVKESMLADWYYVVNENRAVHVDSRFIIWQLQQDPAGRRLLQELNLQ